MSLMSLRILKMGKAEGVLSTEKEVRKARKLLEDETAEGLKESRIKGIKTLVIRLKVLD